MRGRAIPFAQLLANSNVQKSMPSLLPIQGCALGQGSTKGSRTWEEILRMSGNISPVHPPREAGSRRRVGSGCTSLTPDFIVELSNLDPPIGRCWADEAANRPLIELSRVLDWLSQCLCKISGRNRYLGARKVKRGMEGMPSRINVFSPMISREAEILQRMTTRAVGRGAPLPLFSPSYFLPLHRIHSEASTSLSS